MDTTECVGFTGHLRKQDGYGILSRSRHNKQRIFMAHRWVWCLTQGYDPWNLPRWVKITQTCGNHACINPDHLESNLDKQQAALLGLIEVDPKDLITKKDELPILSTIARTQGGLAHRKKTKCSEGHLFREAPDDTPCISCKVQKKQDIMYEVTT